MADDHHLVRVKNHRQLTSGRPVGTRRSTQTFLFAYLLGGLLLLAGHGSHAQGVADSEARKWGAEANVLFPIYPGKKINAKVTRTLWQSGNLRGDALLGFNIGLPDDRDTEGRFSEVAAAWGYRQYFGRGFNVELYNVTGLGKLEKSVRNGQYYNSFDWLVAGLVGYQIPLGSRFYVLPQFGYAKVVYKSDPWPVLDEDDRTKEVGETAFPFGGVQVGVRF